MRTIAGLPTLRTGADATACEAVSGPRICLLGYPRAFLRLLEPVAARGSIVVLEEPDLLLRSSQRPHQQDFAAVEAVYEASYVGSSEHLALAERLHAEKPFDAVITVLEYAVVATALLADRLRLPGAGVGAAELLRDKLALRRASAAGGVANPASVEVGSLADVHRFAREHGGGGLVLKPSNRQASVGVHVLGAVEAKDPQRLREAWYGLIAGTDAAHLPDRQLPVAYLAEERLVGREVSVEALVSDGVIGFQNSTEKWVVPGLHPVERGHVVPARIPAADAAALTVMMSRLVSAIGFRTGVLHAEWMLTQDGPVLIECAGRLPGDRIVELIDLAWDVNVCAAFVDLMCGRPPELPAYPQAGAAVAFLGQDVPAGWLNAVSGVDAAQALPGVVDVAVTVTPGDPVQPWQSSWDRSGSVVAHAEDPEHAAIAVSEAARLVRFDVARSQEGVRQ